MAVGATTISGAYTVADGTWIDTFFTTYFTVSGSQVLVLPDANNSKFYLGIVEGGGG